LSIGADPNVMLPRRTLRALAVLLVSSAVAVAAPSAGAIIGGTDQVGNGIADPVAFIVIETPTGSGECTGTLISPTVVMTAAHCVYDTTRDGNLLGIARPSDISVRIGSHNVADASQGTDAGVVAVLPQPHYRWDGSRVYHDVALLALDRAMPQPPAALAEQRPDAGKPLLIAGYGQTSSTDETPAGALRAALIDAADPASCQLVSELFDPSWLFCGAAATDPAQPGGTACHGDSGGPAFAFENSDQNLVVEGVISYGSRADCEYSRTYLVLVSSERGFIDHALATPAPQWSHLRDDPPTARINPVSRRLGERGVLSLRINDDKSRHSRVRITFYSHAGKRLSRAFRGVATNQWVRFDLGRSWKSFSGYVCAQGTDATNKPSNYACAADVIK
jgi:secreted trypsin-like serine protease